ncbi:hypothetical protein D3C73_1173290 [compost metagenome]
MNHKNSPGRGGHFNAHESRLLIELIDFIRILQASLKDVFGFEIIEEYKDILDTCRTFLSGSGGSSIPEDFKIIVLVEGNPIFTLSNATVVNVAATSNITAKLKQIGEGSYAKVCKYKDPYYGINFVI